MLYMYLYGPHTLLALSHWLNPNIVFNNEHLQNKKIRFENSWKKYIRKIYIQDSLTDKDNKEFLQFIKAYISRQNIVYKKKSFLNELCKTHSHQGIVVDMIDNFLFPNISPADEDIKTWLNLLSAKSNILILDRIQDPHNLGAIMRTAEALGIEALILGKRDSCPISSIVHHVSTGASLLLPVKWAANLSRTLEVLKQKDYWIVASDIQGSPLEEFTFSKNDGPYAIIVGSEGFGVKNILLKQSDYRLKITMHGYMQSLNASVSAGIFIQYFKGK